MPPNDTGLAEDRYLPILGPQDQSKQNSDPLESNEWPSL
jgi:hypothetical protein